MRSGSTLTDARCGPACHGSAGARPPCFDWKLLLAALQKVPEAPHKPQPQQQQQQRLSQAQRPAVGNPEAVEDAEEVPEQVYSRILARILTFTGFVGMLLFPLFYYLKVRCCSRPDSYAIGVIDSLGRRAHFGAVHQHNEVAA